MDSGLSAEEVSQEQAADMLNMSGRTPFIHGPGRCIALIWAACACQLVVAKHLRKARTMTNEQSESFKSSVRQIFPGMSDEDLFYTNKS